MIERAVNYQAIWGQAVDDADKLVRGLPYDQRENTDSKMYRLALGPYKLQCFLHRLVAQYDAPWVELTPKEAARIYLINTHHWAPQETRELQPNDLMTILHLELQSMELDAQERDPVVQSAGHMTWWASASSAIRD